VPLENQRHLRKPLKKANINRTTRRTNAERELPIAITNEYERNLELNGNPQYTNTRQENQHNLNLETPSVS